MLNRNFFAAALLGASLALGACGSNSSNSGDTVPNDTDANGSADINGYDTGPDSAALSNAGEASTRGPANNTSGSISDDGNGRGTGPMQGANQGSSGPPNTNSGGAGNTTSQRP